MYKLLLYAVLILGLADFMEAVTLNCAENLKPCSDKTCYDPSVKVCLEAGKHICNIGEELCGESYHYKICYSPVNKSCLKGPGPNEYMPTKFYVCEKDEKLCGEKNDVKCYSPTTHSCSMDNVTICEGSKSELCGPGRGRGGKCYSTTTHTCFEIQAEYKREYFVCKKEEKLCSGYKTNECYSPSTHICLDGVLCNNEENVCGRQFSKKCYSPSTHTCLERNICKKEEKLCGPWYRKECYSPSTHSCVGIGVDDIEVICEGLRAEICGQSCYNPDAGTHLCEVDTLCKIGERGCRGKCYNTNSTETLGEGKQHCYDVHFNSTTESYDSTLLW